MLKTKNIMSILLVSIFAMALAFPMVPKVSAADVNITVEAEVNGTSIETYFSAHTGVSWTVYPTPTTIVITRNVHVLLDWGAQIEYGGHYYRFDRLIIVSGTATKEISRSELLARPEWPDTENARIVIDFLADTAATIKAVYCRAGPAIDVVRMPVISHPDAALIAMQTGTADVSIGLIRTGDVEKLTGDGHTVTFDPGFHMGHVGYNIRPLAIQQERRPTLTCWPLEDVQFRHALFYCYDQDAIVSSIYGYTVTPIRSLVPNAQGGWLNPNVPAIPYNPGNPFTSPAGEPSACGVLKAAGYTFEDADSSGTVTSADYWKHPSGNPIPNMRLFTPTAATAPTSCEHGARFIEDLGEIGLAATPDNGYAGLEHEPAEFADYMDKVDSANFDAYMVFWSLGRFPDHLYDMCHSSQDCYYYPKRYNFPGIHDDVLDDLVLTIKTSLDHAEKLQACWDAQERLYRPDVSDQALAYMQLYSRIYFNAHNLWLRGIVKSPGYGTDNGWTWLNMHWETGHEKYTTGGETLVNWIWGEKPERMNPCYASTVYAWDYIDHTLDGLIDVNPYTHEDLPAMAESWDVVETPSGPGAMEITFHLRKDVFWQDGNPYTADDAKFNWLFLRDNMIPRFTSTWQYIIDVDVIDDYTVKVILSETSQFLLYDLAGTAAMLPPCVWSPWDGKPLLDILAWDPSTTTTKPTGAGPWFGTPQGPSTQLYGTGPFVFDYYDSVGMVGEMSQFPGYYRCTEDIRNQKVEMFHRIGDVNRDGTVWADDRGQMGAKFGIFEGEPEYDINVDVNEDGIIDMGDISLANWFFGDQKEYP